MKNLIRYLAFALMVGVACAQSNLPNCQGSDTTKWSNCTGTKTFPYNVKYVGEFKDGQAHGRGTATYSGSTYIGEFKDGYRNGQGTFTYSKGNKYVGEFKDDQKNGQGTRTYESGKKYVGGFKDDKMNGQGTFYASNGSIIMQGIWVDDYISCSTPIQQATAPSVQQSNAPNPEIQSNLPPCQYSGDTTKWSNCTGTKYFPNGAKYVGEFKDGKLHGQGTAIFANGAKYVGEHKDDKVHGQGTETFANGDKYVGEFKDNKKNGEGTLYSSNGSIIIQGIWLDNTFATAQRNMPACSSPGYLQVCFDTNTNANGDKYVGEFKDGKLHGQGTLIFANGAKYVGEFKDGEFNGQGTLTGSGSTYLRSTYIGEFKDGYKNGQGTLYDSMCEPTYQGMWVKGISCEPGEFEKKSPWMSFKYPLEWQSICPRYWKR